jgi:hypothetical protein
MTHDTQPYTMNPRKNSKSRSLSKPPATHESRPNPVHRGA